MFSILLFSFVSAFDLAIGMSFDVNQKAGNAVTFDLYNPTGGVVPASSEMYDVTLLDGRVDPSNAKTISTLLSGVTKTKGISVTLPSTLVTGDKYFFGIVAKSGTKYSGFFKVSGSASSTASPTESPSVQATTTNIAKTDTTDKKDSGNSSSNSPSTGSKKYANSSGNTLLVRIATLLIAINIV